MSRAGSKSGSIYKSISKQTVNKISVFIFINFLMQSIHSKMPREMDASISVPPTLLLLLRWRMTAGTTLTWWSWTRWSTPWITLPSSSSPWSTCSGSSCAPGAVLKYCPGILTWLKNREFLLKMFSSYFYFCHLYLFNIFVNTALKSQVSTFEGYCGHFARIEVSDQNSKLWTPSKKVLQILIIRS